MALLKFLLKIAAIISIELQPLHRVNSHAPTGNHPETSVIPLCSYDDIRRLEVKHDNLASTLSTLDEKLNRIEAKMKRITDQLDIRVITALDYLQNKVAKMTYKQLGADVSVEKEECIGGMHCPCHLEYLNGRCYKFFETMSAVCQVRGTWEAGRQHCQAIDADLVSIETEEENQFILRIIRTRNLVDSVQENGAGFWTSGTDKSGSWKWAVTDQQISYSYWAPGEPKFGLHTKCLHLWKQHDFKWDDIPCTYMQNIPICEAAPLNNTS